MGHQLISMSSTDEASPLAIFPFPLDIGLLTMEVERLKLLRSRRW